MIPNILKCVVAAGLASSMLPAADANLPEKAARVPVLLELFTSEGCSSCPPADKLLQKLDHDQPVAEAELIVLSEHVDYWNRLGWTDPYSSSSFSQRQQDYSSQLHTDDVYTPQLVIDGAQQVVGGNWADAQRAIQSSLKTKKIPVSLVTAKEGSGIKVHLEVGPVESAAKHGVIYIALAADRASARVRRGENAGRDLSHVAVVYSIRKIGAASNTESVQRDVAVPELSGVQIGSQRIIVFVQDSDTKRIVGVAKASVEKSSPV